MAASKRAPVKKKPASTKKSGARAVSSARTNAKPRPRSSGNEKNRCFFPLEDGKATFAAVKKALAKRFEILEKSDAGLRFRWRYFEEVTSPTFALALGTAEEFTLAMAKKKASSALSTSYAVLSFDDLDEVLGEANGLIEAQAAIQRVTKGPFFLAWNGERVDL